MPIIAVEGMDSSGKTTLISQLRQTDHSFWCISRSKPIKTIRELDSFLSWLDALPHDQLIVLDRHPLVSEKVYGPLLRGKDLTENLDPDIISTHLGGGLSRLIRVIYCRPPSSVIKSNLWKNPQLDGVPENFLTLLTRYDNVMALLKMGGIPVIYHDYTSETDNHISHYLDC